MANPVDATVVGQALEDAGFAAFQTISGLGLNTRGFLWPCSAIWQPTDDSSLSTTWVATPGPSSTTEVCTDYDF